MESGRPLCRSELPMTPERKKMSTMAVKTVPIAVARQPEPAGGGDYLARAVALHLAGKREEALKQLQRATAANAASPEIYRAMGHIQFEMGDHKEAAKTY